MILRTQTALSQKQKRLLKSEASFLFSDSKNQFLKIQKPPINTGGELN